MKSHAIAGVLIGVGILIVFPLFSMTYDTREEKYAQNFQRRVD